MLLTAAAGRYTNTSPTNVNISPVEAGSGVSKMCVKPTPAAAVATPPAGSGDVCFVVFATPTSVAITAGFEFDVPVRFDTDALDVTLDLERLGSITSIPLLEIRT